jgi:hypothetical protein
VYSLNPALTEMLAKERVADLNRCSGEQRRLVRLNSGRLGSVKRAAGWALVEVGLRLAVPRHGVPSGRPSRGPAAAGCPSAAPVAR